MLRWIALLLVCLNLTLAAMHWYQYRNSLQPEVYVEQASIASLNLLGEQTSASASQCVLLGPADQREQVVQWQAALAERGVASRLVEQSLEKAPSFWVFDGPFATREERERRYQTYQELAIDSFIIRQGVLAGNISVGVFENIDSARRMVKRMEKRGFTVSLRPIAKQSKAYWLEISDLEKAASGAEILPQFKGLAGAPESRQIFCKSVASPK